MPLDFSYAVVSEGEATDPYPYVHVEKDGSYRELTEDERLYLQEPFHPADGGRPYLKPSYRSRTLGGDRSGFLRRSALPRGLQAGTRPRPWWRFW